MTLFKLSKDQFFYLCMLASVFVISFALSLNEKPVITELAPQSYDVSLLPILSKADSFPVLSAEGVLAVDLDSGVTLYEKNADTKLLPASTTKVLTGLLALEHYSLSEVLSVGKINVDGQKMGLFPGEKISAESLLYGLLVYSANDAAEVLAQNYPGGRDSFIKAMNKKAQELEMANSVFLNPTGLDGNGHFTTPRDLIRLSQVAIDNPNFAKIVATKSKMVTSIDGQSVYYLENINRLLGEVEGVKGIKTGWTEDARENLITLVERDNKSIIIALLASQDRFGETKELIDWIFANFEWVLPNGRNIPE